MDVKCLNLLIERIIYCLIYLYQISCNLHAHLYRICFEPCRYRSDTFESQCFVLKETQTSARDSNWMAGERKSRNVASSGANEDISKDESLSLVRVRNIDLFEVGQNLVHDAPITDTRAPGASNDSRDVSLSLSRRNDMFGTRVGTQRRRTRSRDDLFAYRESRR